MSDNNLQIPDEDVEILVEFYDSEMKDVGIKDFTEEHIKKSKEAIINSLRAIAWVAQQARTIVDKAAGEPDETVLEFGIKIGSKAGMLVAQADSEFHIKATLKWTR